MGGASTLSPGGVAAFGSTSFAAVTRPTLRTTRSKGLGPAARMTLPAARRQRDYEAVKVRRDRAGGVTMAGIRPQAGPGVLFKDAATKYLATQGPRWTVRHKAGLEGLIENYAG